MKNYLLLLILFFFGTYNVQAADNNTVRLKGIIVDKSTSKPLEFSTVSLSDSTGKAIAVSAGNEKGEFTLAAIPVGEYKLKVSYVGYAELIQPISITAGQVEIDLGNIAIEPDAKQLEAVVLIDKRPSIERQIDKLIVNIGNTAAAENSTADELLKKAPGVAIDRDGNVTLNGQAVQVWVDNRPTHLSGQDLLALLTATEGSTIDKIEIIDNPSSKYDAAGSAGIINIKTKKNFLRGFNGNVRTGYTQYIEEPEGYFYSANASINLNYRSDLISTFLNYGLRRSEGFSSLSEEVESNNGYRRQSNNLSTNGYTPQGIKTGLDFFIDKKNTIGIIGDFNFRTGKEDSKGNAIVGHLDAPLEKSETTGESTGSFRNGTLNLNYTHLFGEKTNHDFTANLDYIYFSTAPTQYSHTDFLHSPLPKFPEIFQNNSKQTTQVLSGKADYTRPINKKMNMEAGGKIAYSYNDSEMLRRDSLPTGWEDNNLSNAFEYDEIISALYANYSWQINKQWSAKVGLRWENTYSKGTWKTADSITSQSYNDFFPTLFMGYTPHEKHSFSLSYTRRLQRPSYWQLNPFRRYAGAYTYIEGNPQLSPSYSDNIRLSYTAFQRWNMGTSFSYNKGMIVQVPTFETTGHTGYRQGNFGYNYYFAIWVSVSELPIVTGVWYLTSSVYGAYIMNDDNNTTTYSKQANLYLNTSILFNTSWSMEIEGRMQTPTIWGYYDMKSRGSVNMGVKKTFGKHKGALSLYLDDIFKTDRSHVTMLHDGTMRYAESLWTSRAIRFSFSWRFGNMGKPERQRRVGQQDEAERLGGSGSGSGSGGSGGER